MKYLRYLFSILLLASFSLSTFSQSENEMFKETFFILEETDGYKQVVLLKDSEDLPGDRVEFETEDGEEVFFDLKDLDMACNSYVIPYPEVTEETKIKITFWEVEGHSRPRKGKARYFIKLHPQKHWVFYLTPHTHLDVGYTEHQEVVWEKLTENLLYALDLIEETIDWPAGSRYKWTIEQSIILEKFIEYYPEEVPRLVTHILHGNVEVCGYYMNMLSSLCSSEETVRLMYPAEKLRKEYELKINTAMINDIPGYTWNLAQVFTKSGIEFLSLRANAIRGKFLWFLPGAVPRPFYWQSPDGTKILTWYTDSYREGNFMRTSCGEDFWETEYSTYVMANFEIFIKRLVDTEYPHNDVQMRMGGDNIKAVPGPSQVSKAWNSKWAFPKLILATNRDFYEVIRNYENIPVFKADIPDYWTDGAGSSAFETAITRRAQDDLASGEMLSSIIEMINNSFIYPRHRIESAYKSIMMFNEHTWGSSSDLREKNELFQKTQWNLKSGFALTGWELSRSIIENAKEALHKMISNPGRVQINVFNPLSWPRSGLIKIEMQPDEYIAEIRDLTFDTIVPFQKVILDSNKAELWLIAENVPAMGYKTYSVKMAVKKADDSLMNVMAGKGFYDITYNDDGQITGINYLPDGKELIDPENQFGFNRYIYETGNPRVFIRCDQEIPEWERKREVAGFMEITDIQSGPVADIISTRGWGPGTKIIEKQVIIYKKLNMVQMGYVLDKTKQITPEAVYISFPFNMNKPEVVIDIPTAAMHPISEQMPLSNRDYYTIERYLQLKDNDGTISFCSPDAPLFTLYDITTERWQDEVPESNGNIYCWALNNYWFTNYRFWQEGNIEYNFYFRYDAGSVDNAYSDRFALECSRPLISVLSTSEHNGILGNNEESFMSVNPGNVLIQAIKPAESGKGWIIRLNETSGKPVTATLRGGRITLFRAWETDMVENMENELNISNNSIQVQMKPYDVKTIWLWLRE